MKKSIFGKDWQIIYVRSGPITVSYFENIKWPIERKRRLHNRKQEEADFTHHNKGK